MMRLFRVWTKAKRQSWVAAHTSEEAREVAFSEGRAKFIDNLIAEDYTDKVSGDLTVLSVLTKPNVLFKYYRKGIKKWTDGTSW